MFDVRNMDPAYSHVIVIPPLVVFFIWRQRALLATMPFRSSWWGPLVVFAGFGLWYLATLSTIPFIGQYGFLVVLYGLVLALAGSAVFRALAMPLLMLLFMIPLPAFFSNSLSLRMQLLSSSIGVDIIRLFQISVFLEGNVIDFGTLKLQVVEACDGLRYLFPLMTLAFIVAYLFRAPFWKRAIVFLASVPVAILMNSARIGLIGVTVEYWGESMAEGVLHDFEGWVVFMLSIVVLLVLAAVLNRLGGTRAKLSDVLALDFGAPIARTAAPVKRPLSAPFLIAIGIAVAANVLSVAAPERVEIRPSRHQFVEFPGRLDSWQAVRAPLDPSYVVGMGLDDYLLANFQRPDSLPVNLWVAWYDSQRSGQSVHSPKSCLPGGGWEIRSLTQPTLKLADGRQLVVNRALIQQGNERQLVYYWFEQRGRTLTNEYLVKWYIIQDAILRNRTDGALVRLIVPVPENAQEADVDRQLTGFASSLVPKLDPYLPG
jgi:exosortase D (VPLPA-CTERM-specific)